MNAKTTADRVAALRERRAALGLMRLELYAHPEDHAALKALASKLSKRRSRSSAETESQPRGAAAQPRKPSELRTIASHQ